MVYRSGHWGQYSWDVFNDVGDSYKLIMSIANIIKLKINC